MSSVIVNFVCQGFDIFVVVANLSDADITDSPVRLHLTRF